MQGMSRVEEVSIDAPARFIELSTARDRFPCRTRNSSFRLNIQSIVSHDGQDP
jgi:hypothetical protein